MKKAHFVPTSQIADLTSRVFEEEKKRIKSKVPDSEVIHVGSSAIPNSLTLGDLDIQVRVQKKRDFETAIKALKYFYDINHPELWTSELALFTKKDHPEMPLSVMVTMAGSKYDEYEKQNQALQENPDLLAEYNNLKRGFEGKPIEDYKKAKRGFFGPNGESRII